MLGRTSEKPTPRNLDNVQQPRSALTHWYDEGTVIPFDKIAVAYPRASAYEDEEVGLIIQMVTGLEMEVNGIEKVTTFLSAYLSFLSAQGIALRARTQQGVV